MEILQTAISALAVAVVGVVLARLGSQRFDALEGSIARVDQRLDGRFDALDATIDALGKNVDAKIDALAATVRCETRRARPEARREGGFPPSRHHADRAGRRGETGERHRLTRLVPWVPCFGPLLTRPCYLPQALGWRCHRTSRRRSSSDR